MQATAGPFPRAIAAQPSLRVAQGSIVWRQLFFKRTVCTVLIVPYRLPSVHKPEYIIRVGQIRISIIVGIIRYNIYTV